MLVNVIAFIALVCLISLAVYANIFLHNGKKNGSITKEDLNKLEEDMKMW